MPTFKMRHYECRTCEKRVSRLAWDYDPVPECHGLMGPWEPTNRFGSSAHVIQDSIPGGQLIEHGICHTDGTPRRFDSKSDIKRAARDAGWTPLGDTPKPKGDRWV
jgi:hypothetical protein